MQPVAIAPGAWLDAPAAASWARMVAAGCPTGGITDAGRTYAEQYEIYYTWLRELSLPKRLRKYKGSAAKPGESKHETGRALDLSGATLAWVRKHGAAYGFIADRVKGEKWHVEYVERRDTHRVPVVAVATARAAAPAAQPHTIDPWEPIMRILHDVGRNNWYLVGEFSVVQFRTSAEVAAARLLYPEVTGTYEDVEEQVRRVQQAQASLRTALGI